MQWLIDLIIEAIGVPPCYIDRGDPLSVDFDDGDLTLDGAYYDLDLSSIVPAGATAVALNVQFWTGPSKLQIIFRKNGILDQFNVARLQADAVNTKYNADYIVGCDSNRLIEYSCCSTDHVYISITVKGWWL